MTGRAPAKPDWSVPAEDLVSGTAGAVVGVAVVPILGPAAAPFAAVGAASVVKVAGQMLRKFVGERFVSRAERFENEVFRALGEEPDKIGEHLEDPRFQEVVFQNYRRAIDAIDPVVLPALARLTAMYRGREPDTFFRAAGRLLQDLSADELIALRELLSVCQQVDVQTVSVVSWHTTRWELRFGEPNSKAKPRSAVFGTRLLCPYSDGLNGWAYWLMSTTIVTDGISTWWGTRRSIEQPLISF